ncbi:hypothetical protein DY023_14885 [Microbacterium bovistercoris]|uniref:Uncharacterized protein n=1 Tax=Microbacterium bovistercoris TaxID=2293570 RepID=A0A371NPV0_9MICO|nr:hypothetical protein [Microbacterium bovistercoris]REJ04190.1 hypothetical protein DY023_14885 [Microbacterium bovistercoris]
MTDLARPETWTERYRLVTDPSTQKSLGSKGIIIALISIVGVGIGVALIALGRPILGWIVVALGVIGALVWSLIALNSKAAAKMTGDDLIEIVVADEGLLVQGGLPVLWSEVARINYLWSAAPSFTGGLAGVAANAAGKAMDSAGVDRSKKSVTISLKDYDAVKARATTKARKMVLYGPMLGDPATVMVGLMGRSDAEMQQLLQLLHAAGAQHGFALTRDS